jgi:hypothetical protein
MFLPDEYHIEATLQNNKSKLQANNEALGQSSQTQKPKHFSYSYYFYSIILKDATHYSIQETKILQ